MRGHVTEPGGASSHPLRVGSLRAEQITKGMAATFPVSGRFRKPLASQARARGRTAWTLSILGQGWTPASFPHLEA